MDLPFAVGAPRVQPGPGLIPPGFGPPRPATPFRGPWKRRPTPPANTASLPPPTCCRPISTARSSTRRPTGTSAVSCARPRRTRHSPPKAAQIVVPAAGRSQNAYRRCVPARRRPTDGPERAGIATLRQKCSAGGPIALGPEIRSGPEFTCSLARTGGLNELARARQWAETRHRPRPSVRLCRRPLPRARQGRGAPSSTGGHPAGGGLRKPLPPLIPDAPCRRLYFGKVLCALRPIPVWFLRDYR